MKQWFRKIQYNSPVILTFTFISFGVFVLGWMTKGISTNLLFMNYRTSFLDIMQYPRLVTHIFGHANWEHFFNNFVLILLVGPMLEEKYGSKNLIKIISITAIVTGLLNTIFFTTALLGASGIAFMFILLGSFANSEENKIPLTFIIILFVFVGREVYSSIMIKDNISHLTHIIGGLCGSYFGYKIGKAKK